MARKRMNDRMEWFPCYPENLLNALQGMPADEGWLYVVVLLRIYESWGPCKDNDASLMRRTSLPKRRFDDAMAVLTESGRLVRTPEGIRNPQADEIMREQDAYRARMRKRAASGWEKRKEKAEGNQGRGASSADRNECDKEISREGNKDSEGANAPSPPAMPSAGKGVASSANPPEAPDARVYRRGKEVLGKNAGGMVRKIIEHHGGILGKAMAMIEEASEKQNPREWIGGVLRRAGAPQRQSSNGFAALVVRDLEGNGDDHDGPTLDLDAALPAERHAGVSRLPAVPDKRRSR